MSDASKSLLGKETDYSQGYSPELLFPLDRRLNRQSLPFAERLPFHGEDLWTGYELSWLTVKGKPVVAIADFHIPADSPCMIESKSFKLYLNGYNHERFADLHTVRKQLEQDLSKAAGKTVRVDLRAAADVYTGLDDSADWTCLDELDVSCSVYQPDPALLRCLGGKIDEAVCSHLLRSNCPVTGQPDWASIYIRYSGPQIEHESLLQYLVSFRQCQDFHEHCVERIFADLQANCGCESLSVYARYTRRGGLDINPYRATFDLPAAAPLFRTPRQ
jgi:7-cyano-7-deazaguanine reductase